MRKGFSLIELLIYVSILGIISVLFIGILTTSTRVQVHEVALAEVGNQANFVLQTIQRLVRESSLIEEANQGDNNDTTATEVSYLKLRMKDVATDPTCISLVGGTIYAMQGPGSVLIPQNCKEIDPLNAINTNKVTVPTSPPGLLFDLNSNSPAHDVVGVALTMSYANAPVGGQYSKTLQTAIGRVSAATFDSGLFPASRDTQDIGLNGTRWLNLFVNNIDVSGTITQGGNYNGTGRGYMTIGAEAGTGCDSICTIHGNTCNFVLGPLTSSGAGNTTPICSSTIGKRICFCQ